jgi:hypothetical protein
MRSSRHWFEFTRYLAVLAAAAGSVVGCASNRFVSESIPDRMKAHADAYRHVGILSLALTSQAITDTSLTTNDLELLSRRLGTNLLNALTQAFSDKGYQVTRACNPLCTAEDWEELDRQTGGLATEGRTNLIALSEEIYANRPNEKFNPVDYRIPPSIAALARKLGQDDVDVLVLLDSKLDVETPEAQHKRNKWNWTGGAILTPVVVGIGLFGGGAGGAPDLPLKYSPAWVAHTILISDARTQEVLFWNSRTFLHEDARNTEAMRAKFRELMGDFAQLPKK